MKKLAKNLKKGDMIERLNKTIAVVETIQRDNNDVIIFFTDGLIYNCFHDDEIKLYKKPIKTIFDIDPLNAKKLNKENFLNWFYYQMGIAYETGFDKSKTCLLHRKDIYSKEYIEKLKQNKF